MMIRLLQPGDEALSETFLQPRIASSMFLVSNMRPAGLVDNGRLLKQLPIAEKFEIVGHS